MNYRRGFLRAYAFIAVCWIAFWVLLGGANNLASATEIGLVFIPVIVGYVVLFVIVPWIGKGFNRR